MYRRIRKNFVKFSSYFLKTVNPKTATIIFMKQIKILLLILLFSTASIGISLFGSEPFDSFKVMQNKVEIIDANEISDIKEEPSFIRISYLYQEFITQNNTYHNPLHISEANPFIPIKPPRKFS